jgi:hypothetical protein
LHANGLVELQRVAELLEIVGTRAVAEHLRNGIAGHDVD